MEDGVKVEVGVRRKDGVTGEWCQGEDGVIFFFFFFNFPKGISNVLQGGGGLVQCGQRLHFYIFWDPSLSNSRGEGVSDDREGRREGDGR